MQLLFLPAFHDVISPRPTPNPFISPPTYLVDGQAPHFLYIFTARFCPFFPPSTLPPDFFFSFYFWRFFFLCFALPVFGRMVFQQLFFFIGKCSRTGLLLIVPVGGGGVFWWRVFLPAALFLGPLRFSEFALIHFSPPKKGPTFLIILFPPVSRDSP